MKPCIALCFALLACGEPTRSTPAAPKPPAAPEGAAADALWALAPDGITTGLVITAHGMLEVERGLARLKKVLAVSPGALRDLAELLLSSRLPQFDRFADLGMSTDHGLAVFDSPAGWLAVLPVTDRDRFAKRFGLTRGETDVLGPFSCKPTDGRYICADTPAVLARLGKGAMRGTLAAAGARGDIEDYLGLPALGSAGITAGYFAVRLDDGVLDLHGFLAGSVAKATPYIGAPTLAPEPHAGAFALGSIAPLLAGLPPLPIVAHVTAADLARSMTGAITASVSSTDLAFRLRAPLSDPRPWQAIVASCDQLGGLIKIPMHAAGTACHVDVPGALVPVSFDLWVEGGELRAGNHQAPFVTGKADALDAVGRELASGAWTFAMWGRGTMFSAKLAQTFGATLDPVKHPELPMVLRAIAQVDELGLGGRVTAGGIAFRAYARTIWSNPSDVAEQIAAIPPEELISGRAEARAAAIAAAHPRSPFAADLAAGPGGMMLPATVVGILAGVAVPAFLDYMKKTKKPEAETRLAQLGDAASKAYATTGKFPVGFAPLTPAQTCCTAPHGRCVWSDADKQQPVWTALGFVQARPELFRYSYASDGSSFNATAVGDLDCDGIEITYTLSGTADGGTPRTSLTRPAPNSD